MSDDKPKNLFTKLAEVTAEITGVEAKGQNTFLRTTYVLEDDLINAVRAKLTDRKVVMLPSLVSTSDRPAKKSSKDTTITDVVIDWTFCDGETGETYTCRWTGRGEDPTDKGLAMAETSALRTFLLKTFLVPKGSDEKPAPPVRADGQKPLTDEQFDGIVSAWDDLGRDEAVLAGVLDAQKIPTTVEGADLALSQRCRMLTALQAIEVQKSLMALKPAPVPA